MIALTRGDVLQIKPFPTVEQAYAHVRREDLRQAVMMAKEDTTPGAVMLSKGGQKPQQHSSLQMLSGEKQKITKAKSQVELADQFERESKPVLDLLVQKGFKHLRKRDGKL